MSRFREIWKRNRGPRSIAIYEDRTDDILQIYSCLLVSYMFFINKKKNDSVDCFGLVKCQELHLACTDAERSDSRAQARFPFKRNRLRCVRCVNENRKKRKRLRLNGNRAWVCWVFTVSLSTQWLSVTSAFINNLTDSSLYRWSVSVSLTVSWSLYSLSLCEWLHCPCDQTLKESSFKRIYDMIWYAQSVSVSRMFGFVCLFVCLSVCLSAALHSSKANDPKVFKLRI